MTYLELQLRKVFKNKLTPVTLLLVVGILLVVLGLNIRSTPQSSLQKGAKNEISFFQKENARLTKLLKHNQAKGEVDKETQTAIADNQKVVKEDRTIIQSADKGNWRRVYEILFQQKQIIKKLENKNAKNDSQSLAETTERLKYFDYLKKNPLSYENQSLPVTGWQFYLHINQQYLPYVFVLVLLVLLTILMTESYHNKLNIARLLPIAKNGVTFTNINAGICLSVGSFLTINLLMFILASFFSGTGSLLYPYATYRFVGQQVITTFVPTANLLLPILLLQLLELTFLIVLVQLLAKIFKDKLPTLLVSITFVLGGNIAVMVVPPLRLISAWLPTTYLNAVDVVSGSLAKTYQNPQISLNSGLFTLVCSTLLVLFLSVTLDQRAIIQSK